MGMVDAVKEMFANMAGSSMPNQAAMSVGRGNTEADKEKFTEQWRRDVKRRKIHEQQWQLNLSMVMGSQWVGWSGSAVQPLAAPSWRVQAVHNHLFVRCRSKMTRLLADMEPTSIPDSSEHIDIRRAEYKERMLHHIRREIGDDRLRFRAAQWIVTCGEVWTEAYWDESSGETFADDGGAISEGDVAVRIWDPFAVWPGAGCSAGNNGGRIWTVDLVPVELARIKYNDDKISPDASESSDLKLRASMENFFQSGTTRQMNYGNDVNGEDLVMVKTLREYRTAKLPQGRKRVLINDRTYDEQSLLWDGLTHIINFPAYSGYHGDPVELRNSIQPQKSFNRLRSNWEEYVRTMAKGKILCHKSLNIKSSQFDSENMEVVKYEGTGPAPTPWMPPPMPSDTANLMQTNIEIINDLWSDHPASQGKAPASSSGSAINYLQEEDQRSHTATIDEWRNGWARTYEKCLDVVAGKSGKGGYDETRTITVLGENRRADVQRVDPDMLAGRNRVYIALGGGLPQNKTLRAEVIRRWFTDGMLGDPSLPETQQKAMKLTDAGLKEDIYNDEALDEIRAEWENDQLRQGIMVAPRPEDDPLTHGRTITHFMKSDEFLRLDPQIQELFYIHKMMHDEASAPPMMPPDMGVPGGPVPPNAASSPAAGNPQDMLKSAVQGAEPPPMTGPEGM